MTTVNNEKESESTVKLANPSLQDLIEETKKVCERAAELYQALLQFQDVFGLPKSTLFEVGLDMMEQWAELYDVPEKTEEEPEDKTVAEQKPATKETIPSSKPKRGRPKKNPVTSSSNIQANPKSLLDGDEQPSRDTLLSVAKGADKKAAIKALGILKEKYRLTLPIEEKRLGLIP